MQLVALNGKFTVTDNWTLQSNVYVRKFQQAHVDGNDADVERCSGDRRSVVRTGYAWRTTAFRAPTPLTPAFRNQFVVLDQNNNPIPCPPGAGNTCAPVPYGTVDRTNTDATTVGASLQATNNAKLFGHGNRFTVGGSIDHSWIGFRAKQRARLHLSGSFGRPQSGDPGHRLDHPHARQSSATSRSASTRRAPITGSMPPTRSTSRSQLSLNARRAAQRREDQDGGPDSATSPDLNSELHLHARSIRWRASPTGSTPG